MPISCRERHRTETPIRPGGLAGTPFRDLDRESIVATPCRRPYDPVVPGATVPRSSSPTHVLRAITRLNIGGPARQALSLTRELAEDYPTLLVAGTPTEVEGELSDPAVTVHRVPLVRPLSPANDLRALVALRALMRQHRPRIVHTHMAKAGTLGRIAARTSLVRPRTVHTFHGHVLDGYFSPRATRTFIQAERALARTTDVLVAISPEIRDELLDLGIGRPEQYRVIPLGFDLSDHLAAGASTGTLRRSLGVPDDAVLAGIVGRLVPIKDHETMFGAIARTSGIHLAVIGDGERRSELERSAGAFGIGARVHFLGWRTDVAAVMSELDIVALSSRNEGTPVSLIEAAACARPVVATDVGGVRSVVKDGVTGFVVPPGQPAALARALERLARAAELRAAMGAAAREASAPFSLARLVKNVQALYAEVLASRR